MSRQDTYDLRNQMYADENQMQLHAHADAANYADEEHSVLEDDSIDDEGDQDEYMDDDDGSSDLSIPDESINFDLVYSLHSFAATVEGQANVVKGDSLFLMDDSNSYWWLVRVLKTQEVGYIPAENIETPFERLARLNKHRNVDVRGELILLSIGTNIRVARSGNAARNQRSEAHAAQQAALAIGPHSLPQRPGPPLPPKAQVQRGPLHPPLPARGVE